MFIRSVHFLSIFFSFSQSSLNLPNLTCATCAVKFLPFLKKSIAPDKSVIPYHIPDNLSHQTKKIVAWKWFPVTLINRPQSHELGWEKVTNSESFGFSLRYCWLICLYNLLWICILENASVQCKTFYSTFISINTQTPVIINYQEEMVEAKKSIPRNKWHLNWDLLLIASRSKHREIRLRAFFR